MGRNAAVNQQQRDDATARLVHAAVELFAERGFHATTIAEIAARAGTSKGLVYEYFPTKTALAEAAVHGHLERLGALAAALPGDLSPARRLAEFARAMGRCVDEDPNGYLVYLRALADPEVRDIAGAVTTGIGPWTEIFRDLGVDDPELEARFFHTSLLGILTHRVLSPALTPVAELIERLITVTLAPQAQG